MDMSWGKQWSQEKAKELGIRWGWDILILEIRMLTNWDFAKANDNKFMLREHLHGFPVMNYGLGEGPYLPSADSQLGGEDFHVILRADKGDLIYFVPDRNGLEEGLYVECKL